MATRNAHTPKTAQQGRHLQQMTKKSSHKTTLRSAIFCESLWS